MVGGVVMNCRRDASLYVSYVFPDGVTAVKLLGLGLEPVFSAAWGKCMGVIKDYMRHAWLVCFSCVVCLFVAIYSDMGFDFTQLCWGCSGQERLDNVCEEVFVFIVPELGCVVEHAGDVA